MGNMEIGKIGTGPATPLILLSPHRTPVRLVSCVPYCRGQVNSSNCSFADLGFKHRCVSAPSPELVSSTLLWAQRLHPWMKRCGTREATSRGHFLRFTFTFLHFSEGQLLLVTLEILICPCTGGSFHTLSHPYQRSNVVTGRK